MLFNEIGSFSGGIIDSEYQTKLNEQPYRQSVADIVSSWGREECLEFFDSLEPGQIEDRYSNLDSNSLSIDNMRKVVCLVVWDWGWEGSDWFINNH